MPPTYIYPKITEEGWRTALKDYNDASPIEELAANSYDADAKTFVVVFDLKGSEIHIYDNGTGFEKEAFENLLTLGFGTKSSLGHSKSDRPYLGNYGFGFKSTINLAKEFEIVSFNHGNRYSTKIDWDKLGKALDDKDSGYPLNVEKSKESIHGTYIRLKLKNPITKDDAEKYKKFLSNLPQDNGDFLIYAAFLPDLRKALPKDISKIIKDLKKIFRKCEKSKKAVKVLATEGSDLDKCTKKTYISQKDKNVTGLCYFTGFDKGKKIISLKRGLRGIYIRVNGRLIKKDFATREITQPIHRWVSFETGIRIEASIDWVADQLSLSRGDILFKNEKIKEEFRNNLTNIITQSLKPLLSELEKKAQKTEKSIHRQRILQAQKRINCDKDILIKPIKKGFNYKPESDAELALVFSQPDVITKAIPNHRLIDYNSSAPFDCLLYNEETREFINCELEPKLDAFLSHKRPDDVNLIVCWTRGNWKVGAKKKAKKGVLELVARGNQLGQYKLLVYSSTKSKTPKNEFIAIVLEDILK